MTLILRKCWLDGHSSYDFYYGNTGDIVTAPDWNPEPKCGNGLHGLKNGNGDWSLLYGDDWLVIEANDDDIVDIDEKKCKFRTGKILFRGTAEELRKSEFPSKFNLDSYPAYCWARDIGNSDIMIHKINDSRSAYCWARKIGNHDIMINKITKSAHAYLWAIKFGNKDVMINKVVDSSWAYNWARDIGNHDVMINRITSSEDAYFWARDIGNHDVMKTRITEKLWIDYWNSEFPDNQISYESLLMVHA